MNRSRIDFFLVSTSLCGRNIQCSIDQTLATRAFDHKNPIFASRVKISVFECHLQHADPDIFPPYQKRELLETIGLVHNKIEMVNGLGMSNNPEEQNTVNTRTEFIQEIEALIETLPGPAFFENIEKNCDGDIFFEVLIMHLKNNALAQQKKIYDAQNRRRVLLSKRLLGLKSDYVGNKYEILELEQRLADLNEQEVREELQNMQIFDRLTSEKMTPYFLNLAKSGKKGDSTLIIRSNTGENFVDPCANHDYITGTFEDLYKKPPGQKIVSVEDINNFLGDCSNVHEIENSKLTELEKNRLDRNISIHELDAAINK
jgi:hypothetical protein